MSLLVHLPLNGNLENKGLANVTITNNGATVDDDGKIGKCYSISKNKYISGLLDMDSPEWSIACWVNSSGTNVSSNNTIYLICLQTYSSSTNFYAGILLNNTKVFIVRINGSTYPIGIITTGVWHHLCVTFKNNFVHGYVDGVYLNSVSTTTPEPTSTRLEIGHRYNSTDYSFDGKINDVRIYDHCLSPKEVKEISKGLVAHYKLDELNVRENLQPSGTWGFVTANGTKTQEAYGDNGWHVNYTEKSTSWSYFYHSLDTSKLTQGTTYTVSFDYKENVSSVGLSLTFMAGNATNSITTGVNKTYTGNGNWQNMAFTVTVNSNANIGGQIVYIGGVGTNLGEKWFKNFKLEKGSEATTYTTNNSSDNTIYDSSGYGNNGTTIGTLSLSNNTPRYEYSTLFDGNTSGILITNLNISNIINTALTYSFWIKPDSENGARSVYFGSYSRTTFSIEKTTGDKLRLYWNGVPDIITNLSIVDGQWQHITITKNGTTEIKVYLNGELIQTLTNTYNNLTFPTTYRIGRDVRSGDGTPYKGLMSDFRIYATALSDDDVKELYDTSAFITNNGRFEEYEIIEENDEQITKTGLVKSDNFYESEALYLDEITWTGSGINERHPTNIVNSTTGGYVVHYENIIPNKKYVLELDFSWSGNWTFDETKNIMFIWQGAVNNTWNNTNYFTGKLQSTLSLLGLVKNTTEGGTYHYKCIFSIPLSHLDAGNNYANIGTRCDYHNGTGYFSYGNLNIYPLEQDLDTEQTKIGNNYITAKEFIEI